MKFIINKYTILFIVSWILLTSSITFAQSPQLVIMDGWTVQDMGHSTKSYKKIIGYVKNVGDIDIGYFKIIAEFLDRNGSVVDTGRTADYATIRPGNQKKFEIIQELDSSIVKVRLFIEEVDAKRN